MSELRHAGVALKLLHQAKMAAGIDVAEVYARIGLDAAVMEKHHLRTKQDATYLYWETVEAVSKDPNIGLTLGRHSDLFRGQVLEYLFLSSPTFGDGLKRSIRYQRLLSDGARGELGEDHSGVYIALDVVEEDSQRLRHQYEWITCLFIKFFRALTENKFKPLKIAFKHSEPSDTSLHQQVYGVPCEFAAASNRIYFDDEILALESPHAGEEVLRLHEQLASKQLSALQRRDIVREVRSAIAEVLEYGQADLQTIAKRLELGPRELRSKLNEAGTNFNETLANYRFDLAKQLLADTNETIDEVVYLTGFAEPSTFYRAFKRWSGMTPLEYREKSAEERERSQNLG